MKKKFISMLIFTLLCTILFSAQASTKTDRVRNIISELKNGNVSLEWKEDILSNSKIIDEMYNYILEFDQNELYEISNIENEISAYVKALYDAQGKKSPDLHVLFSHNFADATASSRTEALDILTELKASYVSPDWVGDIKANKAQIEKMLLLAQQYTPTELACVTREERAEMMAYFKALYTMNDYNELELETVLAQNDIPIVENDVKPTEYRTSQNRPMLERTSSLTFAHVMKHADTANIALAFCLCISVFALLVLFLKWHDSKKRHKPL